MFYMYSLTSKRNGNNILISPDITVTVASKGYDFIVTDYKKNMLLYIVPYKNLVQNKKCVTTSKILKYILSDISNFDKTVFIAPCALWTIESLLRINSVLVHD